MKKIKSLATVLMLGVTTVGITLTMNSCTENARVKRFGGNGDIELEPGQKLEMVTWKDSELWILTSDRPDSVNPQTYQFSEKSSWGVIEGSYTIKEQ
jgi:hypothetical protein